MNQDDFLLLGQSKNIGELIRRIEKAAASFDFRYYSAMFAIRRSGETPIFKGLCNNPPEFDASNDPQIALVDPVNARLTASPFPFQYDQDFYANAGCGHLWENAAVHGYKTGLCVGIEISPTTRYNFGLDRCFALPATPEGRTSLYNSFISLALHSSFAARSLLLPMSPIVEPPRLSPREQLVLAMSRDGLTAARIAEKLGLQRSTVNQYVQSAMAKLGAANKIHAVNMAIRFDILK